ncbi:MAG: hypothetical protein ABSD38_19295 [Syntrophorhabdales bacterium]|jgi:hypothetical protein
MKKQNADALRWFVDYFANLDLESIKPGDKAKLLIEAECLWPTEELREYQEWAPPVPLSGKPLGRLAWALEIPPKESPEYWAKIHSSQKAVREFLVLRIVPVVRGSSDRPVSPSEKSAPSIVIRGHDEMLWWVGKGQKYPYTIKFLPVTESQSDYLTLKIFTLLEGYPDHAVRVCRGCGKFFLNLSKREKHFCSNRCMWRVNTQERRKADKEKYNEYQKVLMQDRYREEKGLARKKTKPRKGA